MTRANPFRLGGGTVTNRWLLAVLTLSLAAGVAGCSEDAGPATSTDEIKPQPRRDVVSRMALPLLEVSGLAARDGRIVAVGDHSSDIVSFGLDPAGEAVDVVVHRTGVATGKSGSQWEAIALDGAGNAAVLSETGELFVFAKDLEQPTATVKLDYPSVNALIDGPPWERCAASRVTPRPALHRQRVRASTRATTSERAATPGVRVGHVARVALGLG